MRDIAIPNGVSRVQWSERRILEMHTLCRLLTVARNLHFANDFLRNANSVIQVEVQVTVSFPDRFDLSEDRIMRSANEPH